MQLGDKFKRILCFYLAITLVFEVAFPTAAMALTAGPTQPEMQGFTPIGTSDMVDVFSGDFKYNIPLMDVGGYPLNLSYAAGQSMDAEASWVGLGWSLVPGTINRNMRGLPDDFKGDQVDRSLNMKPNKTWGVNVGGNVELAEFPLSLSLGFGFTYNNYNGAGFSMNLNPAITAGEPAKNSMTFGLGLSASSESGVGIQPTVSFDSRTKGATDGTYNAYNVKVGLSYNSRQGLQQMTISASKEKGNVKSTTYSNGADNKEGTADDVKKDHYNSTSANGAKATISFASPSYVPASGRNYINLNFGLTGKVGGAVFFGDLSGYITGSFSGQYLLDKNISRSAYGYMYSEKSNSNDMMDFNREKDGAISPVTPNLPLSNATYDVYSVTGQGIGGMYRPFRGDVSLVHDPSSGGISGGVGVDVDVDINVGNAVKGGVNVSVNGSYSTNEQWTSGNQFYAVQSGSPALANPDYEPYYFKQAGETAVETDPAYFNALGGFDPVRVRLGSILGTPRAVFENYAGAELGAAGGKIYRTKRARRNEVITPLTADKAASAAYIKTIEDYAANNFEYGQSGEYQNRLKPYQNISRSFYPAHHISEITALRSDGARYVYGIPAYNNKQIESTFNVGSVIPNRNTGLVGYDSGSQDNSGNSSGTDNYFEKVTTPRYAHGYLLTEVLSADYVDLTGNGPTDDDLGTYTKINYSRTYSNYKWRVPYEAGMATYSEGLLSDKGDNKGNYIYGEKEIWYVHSIETKTHVAEFNISTRKDAYGVIGDAGGRGQEKSYKLDKIVLYAKQDKLIEAADNTHQYKAEPVKTVNFEYDYSLCPNVPNNESYSAGADESVYRTNNSGKLTLKKLYFTYGTSKQGKLSPYTFIYADKDHDGAMDNNLNPAYNMKAYDRWSTYMPIPAGSIFDITQSSGQLNTGITVPNNAEFPYTDQTKNSGNYVADTYAWAWNLTNVQLPSGGQINVDFESDDYAYVQNRKAMQMFRIMGAGRSTAFSANNLLFDGNGTINKLYFEVDRDYNDKNEFRRRFLNDENGNFISNMYFKFLMKIKRTDHSLPPDRQELYEYVPGYADLDPNDFGMCTNNPSGKFYAYVSVSNVSIQDKYAGSMVNPISQAGWNYSKIYTPRLAYAQADMDDGSGFKQMLLSMVSAFKAIEDFIDGINASLRDNGVCQIFETGRSFIRLYNPVQMKKGGGYRVKKIRLIDNWKSMITPDAGANNNYTDAEYGQVYDYTTTDMYGNAISSGVASYEPGIGGDENPFRQPVYFEKKNLLIADDIHFQEEPFGESVFPSPGVGYSKITVKNLQYDNVKRTATGKVVHEFYTAKDFPVITTRTGIDPKRFNPSVIMSMLKLGSRDYFSASQGFAIELNDMHGKQKAQWVYKEGDPQPMSGVEYKYKQKAPGRLDNEVLTLEKNGLLSNRQVGVDYDMSVDMRQSTTESHGFSTSGNGELSIFGIIPVPMAMVLMAVAGEYVECNTSSVTKVINRYGLLEKTIAYDQGASIATENKLFDAETGAVLATKTENQFHDNQYSLNFPSHWRYETMGGAYKNVGLTLTGGQLSQANYNAYLYPGDELLVNNSIKLWVISVSPLKLQKITGEPYLSSISSLTVIRSARRNQQGVSIGSIVCENQPWASSGLNFNNLRVISASAVELTDKTKLFCECFPTSVINTVNPNNNNAPISMIIEANPYVSGKLGTWRPYKSYTYLTDRTQDKVNDNLSTRTDGIYTSFSPFYTPSGGTLDKPLDWQMNKSGWTSVSEVSIYNTHGNELENKDALNRYSSALFGYGNSLPIGVASLAKYNQVAFDGFEDYDFPACQDDHLGFRPGNNANVKQANSQWQKESHTGKRSIKLEKRTTKEITKVLQECVPQPVITTGQSQN